MKKLTLTMLLVVTIGLWGNAAAWEEVVVLYSGGHVYEDIYGYPSPVPQGCYWEYLDSNPHFDATNEDGQGNTECADFWMAHCDDDSLVFVGTWPRNEDHYTLGASYDTELTCTVTLTGNSWLKASRQVQGNLTTDIHQVVVEYPDGSQVDLLGEVGEPDQAQIMLVAGTYTVRLVAYAYQYSPYPQDVDPYEGYLAAKWEDPSPVSNRVTTWGALKSCYRQ